MNKNWWNGLKSWQKGALIGGVVGVLLTLDSVFSGPVSHFITSIPDYSRPYSTILAPVAYILDFIQEPVTLLTDMLFLILPFLFAPDNYNLNIQIKILYLLVLLVILPIGFLLYALVGIIVSAIAHKVLNRFKKK